MVLMESSVGRDRTAVTKDRDSRRNAACLRGSRDCFPRRRKVYVVNTNGEGVTSQSGDEPQVLRLSPNPRRGLPLRSFPAQIVPLALLWLWGWG